MKNKERAQLILDSCEEVKKRGWKVSDSYGISREQMVCYPLGAVLLTSGKMFVSMPEYQEVLANQLDCDSHWLYGFSLGWRNMSVDKCEPRELYLRQKKGYKVGRLLRKRYKNTFKGMNHE